MTDQQRFLFKGAVAALVDLLQREFIQLEMKTLEELASLGDDTLYAVRDAVMQETAQALIEKGKIAK